MLSALSLGPGAGEAQAGPDLEHEHLPAQHGHRVKVPVADVGAILVGPLRGSRLGRGAWLWGLLRLPAWGRWLRGSGGPVVWPAWPPGGHGGKRPGGLWLAIWGACGGRQGEVRGYSPGTQPGCQGLLLRTLGAWGPQPGETCAPWAAHPGERPYLATADPSPARPSALGGPPSSSTQPLP